MLTKVDPHIAKYDVQGTPVILIGLVQEKNIIISALSDYPVTIFY